MSMHQSRPDSVVKSGVKGTGETWILYVMWVNQRRLSCAPARLYQKYLWRSILQAAFVSTWHSESSMEA
jgi:hypothetical protein